MTVATQMVNFGRTLKSFLVLGLLCASACNSAESLFTATPPATATPAYTATPAPATPSPTVPPTQTHTAVPTATDEPPTETATEAPSATATSTETATATATHTLAPANTQPSSGDFAPTAPGRWNTSAGADTAAGCSGTVLAPYGPVIIRPNASGGLGWVNTANEDYTLARLGTNVYQYSGATTRGDGTVTIGVNFTSATTFNMTRVFMPSAEAGCTHSYSQTGTFEFAVP